MMTDARRLSQRQTGMVHILQIGLGLTGLHAEFDRHRLYFRLLLEELWYATSELARYVDLQDGTP